MTELKRFLQSLAPITDQEFADSYHNFSKTELKKGDFFIRQGKICRHIAYINRGTLRNFYINDKGEEVTSCFCSKNSLTTSYKSFIFQQPSDLSIQALEETELMVIAHDSLQKLYSSSIVWQNIGRSIAEREYFVMEKYASVLNNESAEKKYLRLLKEQPEILQKANIEDIATYLGVTRRTLSRIRQKLAQ